VCKDVSKVETKSWRIEEGGEENLETVILLPGSGEERPELKEISTELKAMLEETAAYRRYYMGTVISGSTFVD